MKGETKELRNSRKYKRNSGQKYTTKKGKIVNARYSEPLTDCRAKCNTKINNDLCQQLFTFYWSMKSHDRRVTYISSCISFTNPKVLRKRRNTPEKQKNRNKTYHYFVPNGGVS